MHVKYHLTQDEWS